MHAHIGVDEVDFEVAREARGGTVPAFQTAGNGDTERTEPTEVNVLAAIAAAEPVAHRSSGGIRVRHLVDCPLEVPESLEPVPDVLSAVSADHSGVSSRCDHDPSTCTPQFAGDLQPTRSGADHDHPARRE